MNQTPHSRHTATVSTQQPSPFTSLVIVRLRAFIEPWNTVRFVIIHNALMLLLPEVVVHKAETHAGEDALIQAERSTGEPENRPIGVDSPVHVASANPEWAPRVQAGWSDRAPTRLHWE